MFWTYADSHLAPIGRPFASKELAERFAAYWPGHLGRPVPIPETPFNPPIWNVTSRRVDDLTLWYENVTQQVFPA